MGRGDVRLAADLAEIAVSSAQTARAFGISPRIAMLSYATGDSNTGPMIDKVPEATERARGPAPEKGSVIRAAEFFSGIGGWAYAAVAAAAALDREVEVVAAFDVSTACNTVYAHNFGRAPRQRDGTFLARRLH